MNSTKESMKNMQNMKRLSNCPDCLWHKPDGTCAKKQTWIDENDKSCLEFEEL